MNNKWNKNCILCAKYLGRIRKKWLMRILRSQKQIESMRKPFIANKTFPINTPKTNKFENMLSEVASSSNKTDLSHKWCFTMQNTVE